MNPQRNLKGASFMVDANCVNAKQKNESLNLLESWAEQELIDLITAQTAQAEMAFGSDSTRKSKAYSFISSESEAHTSGEQSTIEEIGKAIFPDGVLNANQKNDIDIVFNAHKYQRPLITMDGGSKSQPRGILGSKSELARLGITVLSPSEALEDVRAKIQARDAYAREWASHTSKDLPNWVGKD